MAKKYHDFDAMWAESMPDESMQLTVRIMGEDITLPPVLPARMMLRGLRGGDADKPLGDQMQEMIKDLIAVYGKERVEGWIDSGMHSGQLGDILAHTYRMYTPTVDEADDDENPTKPAKGKKKGTPSKRSSKSGA